VIAPALANAILAMRGEPIRALPLSSQGVTIA
jgi:CO/xanthine dehydrogenase Mo-binding subunit